MAETTGFIASAGRLKVPRLAGWDDFTQKCFSQLRKSMVQGDFASQAEIGKAGSALTGSVRIGQTPVNTKSLSTEEG